MRPGEHPSERGISETAAPTWSALPVLPQCESAGRQASPLPSQASRKRVRGVPDQPWGEGRPSRPHKADVRVGVSVPRAWRGSP